MTMLSDGRTSRERLIQLVQQILASNGPSVPFSCDDPLTEIGLTSLDMVNLMFAVESEFDIVVPQADITLENFGTLASIEALLTRLAALGVSSGR